MHGLLRYVTLLFLASSAVCQSHQIHEEAPGSSTTNGGSVSQTISPKSSVTVSPTPTPSNGTCQSRTANYITHTLPQQCLRTDRVSTNATLTTGVPVNDSTSQAGPYSGSDTATGPWQQPPQVSSTGVQLANSPPDGSTTASPQLLDEQGNPRVPHSTSGLTESVSEILAEPGAESDSPLDNANFLSFEEWRKQNLAKAGQSPEHLGQGHSQHLNGPRQRPGINNALDALGEESEIEIDFSGFGGASNPAGQQPPLSEAVDGTSAEQVAPTSQSVRSKDAGKTCKERTNYASFDCAATVLKTNSESKSASSVLVENKDSYMLNTCSAKNKFFIVELCNDILIDTIVLANYEFFSSIFRHFRVSVSDRYPVKIDKWKDLGTFEAKNTREVQAFLVENPLIWARYLRIEFLTHYGSEYYCPLSLLRVHGTTMLEEFRHQEEAARGEIDEEQVVLVMEADVAPVVAQEPPESTQESGKATLQMISSTDENLLGKPTATSSEFGKNITVDQMSGSDESTCGNTADSPALNATTTHPPRGTGGDSNTGSASGWTGKDINKAVETNELPARDGELVSTQTSREAAETSSNVTSYAASTSNRSGASSHGNSSTEAASTNVTKQVISIVGNRTITGTAGTRASISTTLSNSAILATPIPSLSDGKSSNAVANLPSPQNDSTRSASTAGSAAPPQPSTQESFFKSIHKRLQQLESNSTLSLQYIEEQSRILRDAFSKVEKRQVAATSKFLSHLNETVMTELRGFQQAYDQLWQSTVLELESQRDQHQREMLALGARLTMVADELVWQKRMGIVQATLLLLCLGLVLFSRTGNGSLEMPLMQQMMNKSQTALSRTAWESPPNSPSPNRSPVGVFGRKIWRASTEPVNGNATDTTDSRPQSQDGPRGPQVTLEPPTPTSLGNSTQSDTGDEAEVDADEGIEVSREVRSEPSTPKGTRGVHKTPSARTDGTGGRVRSPLGSVDT